jgi:hypothetical protein
MRIFTLLAALWDFTLAWDFGDAPEVEMMDGGEPFPPKP